MQPTPSAPSLSSRFLRLKIEQDEQLYRKTRFDEINAQLISWQLAADDNNYDDLALVIPEDPTALLTLIIESLLALLQYDVANGSNTALRDIKPGDSVGLIQGRLMFPGIFEGTEMMNGRLYYCVKRADLSNGMVEKIPTGREWRIQPYSSTESVSRRRTTVYGKVLEQILDLPAGGLKTFQKSKMLVVAPDKAGLIESLRNVKIANDPLEAVFPVANYKSVDDWNYVGSFGLNNLKQEPVIGLVANFDMAVDIALRDSSYTLLIVDGAAKLRAHYGDIERLNSEEIPRKVISVLRSTDEDELKTLQAMNIQSWVWKRSDFTRAGDSGKEQTGLFGRHNEVINGLSGNAPVFRELELPDRIESCVDKAYSTLYSLSKVIHPLPEAGMLIRWGIFTMNSWLQLPVTGRQFDDYVEQAGFAEDKKLSVRFPAFCKRLRESYGLLIPSASESDCEALIESMQAVFDYLYAQSPKQDSLIELITNFPSETLDFFCCQSLYAGVFNSLHGNHLVQGRNIEQLNSLPSKNAIITGWSNRRNASRGFLAPAENITILAYKKELGAINQVYHSHPCSPNSQLDIPMRRSLGLVEDEQTSHSEETVESTEKPDIETMLETIIHKFGTAANSTHGGQLEYSDDDDIRQARIITLDDGSFVYADNECLLDKVDRDAKRIQRVGTDSLNPGDELVFASSDRSMFEE